MGCANPRIRTGVAAAAALAVGALAPAVGPVAFAAAEPNPAVAAADTVGLQVTERDKARAVHEGPRRPGLPWRRHLVRAPGRAGEEVSLEPVDHPGRPLRHFEK